MHVDDGGALIMSSVLLSEGKLHLVQERQRFGEPLGSLEAQQLWEVALQVLCVWQPQVMFKEWAVTQHWIVFPECVAKGEGFSLVFGGVFGCVRSMLWPGEVHVHQRGMDGAR